MADEGISYSNERHFRENFLEKEEWIAVSREDLEEKYAIPSAFECYRKQIYRG